MRILVTGSRDWNDWETIWDELTRIVEYERTSSDITIVHGACPTGADFEAHAWCAFHRGIYRTMGISITADPHPADWQQYGKRAGFIRNAKMVNLGADLCLAFIRNSSKGASMTADLAQKAGIETRIYRED